MVSLLWSFSTESSSLKVLADLLVALCSLSDEHMTVQLVPHVGNRKGTNKAGNVFFFSQEAK